MNYGGAAMINGGFGIFTNLMNNYMAQEREADAREWNYRYSEQAANNADARTRKLYADLQSPQALIEQYKEAGMSPSIMANQSVQGSVGQGAQGAGAAGISPNVFGMSPIDIAQTNMLEAQARKLTAEAKSEEGTNELGRAKINKIIAETNNIALKNEWQQYENVMQYIDTEIKEQTKQDFIDIQHLKLEELRSNIDKLKEEIRSAKVKGNIDEKTENAVIQYIENQVGEQASRIVLNKCESWKKFADIQMNVAQMQSLIWNIKSDKIGLQLQEEGVNINRKELEAKINQWAIENGFKEKEIRIKLVQVIANTLLTLRGQNQKAFGDLLNLVPIPKNGISGNVPNTGTPPFPMN